MLETPESIPWYCDGSIQSTNAIIIINHEYVNDLRSLVLILRPPLSHSTRKGTSAFEA